MDEFSKVSIHNHLGSKSADRLINENYDKKLKFDLKFGIEMIEDAYSHGYTLLALTQSNSLPVAYYYLLKMYAKLRNIELLPGVEFNLRNEENKYLHTVVVFDNKTDIIKLSKNIDEIIFGNRSNHVEMNQFLNLLIEYRCILAVHGIKQKDRNKSASTNPETFSELINMSDSIPVVLEDNHKYHKVSLIESLRSELTQVEINWVEKSAVISTADRKTFSEIDSPTYIWGKPTFDDLYYACFMGETRIKRKSDIINKVNYISSIEFRKSDKTQLEEAKINCSHGLNTIIGPSGSGKTLLLDVIKRKLTTQGLENKTISKNCDYEEVYCVEDVSIYDSEGNEISENSGYDIIEGEILYNKVLSAYQSDKQTLLRELDIKIDFFELNRVIDNFNDKINEYIQLKKKYIHNKKSIDALLSIVRSTIKFLNANNMEKQNVINYLKNDSVLSQFELLRKEIQSIHTDLEQLQSLFQQLNSYGEKYELNEKFNSDLVNLRNKMFNSINKKGIAFTHKLKILQEKISIQNFLFNISLEHNNTIGSQSKVITERKQELSNSLEKIKMLLMENIILSYQINIPVLECNNIKESIKINEKEFARLSIMDINLKIKKEDFKECFLTNIGNKPKINVSKFKNEILDLTSKESIETFANTFVDEDYEGRVQLSYETEMFVDYRIELLNVDGIYENIDSISAGNLSKIYINEMFKEKISKAGSNVIILYDQPDTNMEKTFILEELVPKISELRDNYQVFITTHEALLVINSDANNIITANNEKTITKANCIKYENKAFVGVNSKKELILEVAKLIDGHPDAIKKRNTIYGGLLNES